MPVVSYMLFMYSTTISRINITSGEREDIIATEEEEEEADDDDNEEQLDLLSMLIHSSSQIVLSGTEEGDHHSAVDDESSSNYGGYNPTMLYIPCVNDEGVDDPGYVLHFKPSIDSSGDDNTIVDNISSTNNPSSFVLENMTSRPVGIAILNPITWCIGTISLSYPSSSSTASITTRETLYNNKKPDVKSRWQ